MSCQYHLPGTFFLKLALICVIFHGCVEMVKKIVRNFQGVDSVNIDTKEEVAIISGKVDPHTVNRCKTGEGKNLPKKSKPELQIHGECDSIGAKQGKATVSGEKESLLKINKQDKQNHHRKGKVAPQNADLIIKPKAKTIHNGCPEHELELRCDNKPFKCNACREDGFQQRYRCKHCNHECHEECMSPKSTITPEFFKELCFDFCDKKTDYICDACGRKIHGYFYLCEEKKLDLHPCCANLKEKLRISGNDFVLQKEVKRKCFLCNKERADCIEDKKVPGWCYVSEQNKLLCLHVYCVSQIMHKAWRAGLLDRKDNEDDCDASTVLERLDLKHVANLKENGGRGRTRFLKMVAVLIRTVLGILVGDPTVLLSGVIMEVILN